MAQATTAKLALEIFKASKSWPDRFDGGAPEIAAAVALPAAERNYLMQELELLEGIDDGIAATVAGLRAAFSREPAPDAGLAGEVDWSAITTAASFVEAVVAREPGWPRGELPGPVKARFLAFSRAGRRDALGRLGRDARAAGNANLVVLQTLLAALDRMKPPAA